MNTKTFMLALAMGSLMVGCKDKGGDSAADSGAGGSDGGADGGADGGDGGGDTIDSCDWGIDLCFEFVNFDGTEAWCGEMASLYSLSTQYGGECASGAVGQCDLSGAGGDIPTGASDVTAFYYSPGFDAASAADSCASAGGSK